MPNNEFPNSLIIYFSREEDRQVEDAWSKVEDEISARRQREAIEAEQQERMHPTRRPMHRFFRFVSLLAILAAVAMAIGQVVGIFFFDVGPIQYVMRIYVVALCVMVVFNECEWTKYTKESSILRNWVTRGLIYSFVGVLGLEENDTSTNRSDNVTGQEAADIYTKAVAWLMLGVGMLYFLMGITCMQRIYKKQREDFEERVARAPEARQQTASQASAPAV